MVGDLPRLAAIAFGALGVLCAAAGCESKAMDPQPDTFVGVGVEITMEAAGARVVRVLPGGGAAEAGVDKGDVFLEVEGAPTRGQTLAQVVHQLRGEPGSVVQVMARTSDGNVPLKMKRAKLKNF